MIAQMFAQIGTNDLGSFKSYLEGNYEQIGHAINDVKYSYGVKPLLFTANSPYGNLQVNPGTLFGQLTGVNAMSAYMDTDVFHEMPGNLDMLASQYDVIRGRWPEDYREMVVVLADPHQINDYMAYTIGLKDPAELMEMIAKVMQGKELPIPEETMQWTYDDLLNLEFALVPASAKYRYNEEYSVWEDMSGDEAYINRLIRNGETIKVVGIVCPKAGVSATTLSVGIAYTAELTQHVIETAEKSEIVSKQLENPNVDVFTGREFGAEKDEESQLSFEDMITIDEEAISSAFGMNISTSSLMKLLEEYVADIYESSKQDRGPAQAAFTQTLTKLATDMLQTYVKENADENGRAEIALDQVTAIVDEYLVGSSAVSLIQPMATEYRLSVNTFVNVYKPLLMGMLSGYVAEELAADMTTQSWNAHTVAADAYQTEGEQDALTTEETEPTTEETEPTTEETEPTTEETEPTTEETEPTTEETEPTTEETEPTTEETEPTTEETEPTTEETEPTTEETEPTTEETEPTTEETEPTTEETEPTNEETEPTTEETEPTTEETEPTNEETEPTTEETEPTTEETEPTTEETEPTTEETEPTTEETEPTTEETEPTTEETEPTEEIQYTASISLDEIDALVADYVDSPLVTGAAALMSSSMTQSVVRQKMLEQLSGVEDLLMNYIGNSFYVDEEKLASAFRFELEEEELMRLMEAMSPSREEATAQSNLQSLGYADPDQPTAMAIYMTDFAGKEDFLAFLDGYNAEMESAGREDQVISYTDITGIMMSSVRTIIDSVSYVLIAFVAVSLIVSSIMIGIITYISVMERTKEIGVLRAIGASRRNISQVFNAETFIIGLCSGLIGVGVTILLNIPINRLIHHFTDNLGINAQLPAESAVILVLLSMGLTLLGGLIPARQAAKKDPVIALRSE